MGKLIGIIVPPKLHKQVKKRAADREIPMSEMWVKAMEAYLEVRS